MDPKVSIIIPMRNERDFIAGCLQSVLSQSYTNFEVIIVDDCSDDDSLEIVKSFEDARIKTIHNEERLAIARSKNRAIAAARGKYLFFTDADCVVAPDWVEKGMALFSKDDGLSGVYGRVVYVAEDYVPKISDRIRKTFDLPCEFYGCNLALRKDVVDAFGGFLDLFSLFYEDGDLVVRIMRSGRRIISHPDMVVTHMLEEYTLRRFFGELRSVPFLMTFIKNHSYSRKYWQIRKACVAAPAWFLILVCPPLLILYFRKTGQRVRCVKDLFFIPLYYLKSAIMRFYIWLCAVKYRVFVI